MKVPLSWIKEFVDCNLTAQEVGDKLTELGIEVEGILETPVPFEGVVVAKIVACSQHPNAERLRVATVADGIQEHQIVCGGVNCREGIFVALARIGASLQDKEGKAWKIKKSKLRDVESHGMLCSEEELGLAQTEPGTILELPDHLPLGSNLGSYFSDPVLEISLTPNLGHCLSILGIARELAAALGCQAKRPTVSFQEDPSIKLGVSVVNTDLSLCPRYTCRKVADIKVGPSPEWLKKRLEACGMRSINNVVDAANYVMLEIGQPLHIFDADALQSGKIVIKTEDSPCRLTTLDEKEREIPPKTILICDGVKPVAIAGIMGGLSSAATEKTRSVIIEAASFSSTSIRKSSRLLDLKTDSSSRFDRGIDPVQIPFALDRAAALIQQLAGGSISAEKIDLREEEFKSKTVLLRLEKTNELLGTQLSLNEVSAFLKQLEMKISNVSIDTLLVEIPSYRNDVQTEVDLIEEVARIFGYRNIPRRPPRYLTSSLTSAPIYTFETQIRHALLGEGLQECVTCDLISPAQSEVAFERGLGEASSISVLHPRSIDQSVLRSCLLPGLLQVVKHNAAHQQESLSAFEVGRIHFKELDHFREQTCAGIILVGKRRPHYFNPKPENVDFFDLKGIVENLFKSCKATAPQFEPSHLHSLHPWRQARIRIGETVIGVIGEVNPAILYAQGIESRVYFGELNLHDLFALRREAKFTELPEFPTSERDWTITLKETVPIGDVVKAIGKGRPHLLESFFLLDLYQSEKLGKDRKNATFRFIYRDQKKTLEIETVEREHQKLMQSLAEKLSDCVI